nr:helix-turn-helix transcriptional regulator [uncultured Ruminococcus sp.]
MRYNKELDKNGNNEKKPLNTLLDDKRQFGEELGSRIKYVRSMYEISAHKLITNNRLADELHVSASKITSILNGQRPPSLRQLIMLASFFHVTTDYLLGLESDRFDGYEYRDIQKLTGLTKKSITNLIAFQNNNNLIFERDVLFRKHNISYFTRYGLDSNERTTHSIYNNDYSKSIADGPIILLELDSNLETKLSTSGFWSISNLLSSRELTTKKIAKLTDSEMMEVKRILKKFLKNRLPEVDAKPQTEGTQSDDNKTTCELRFLNSITESNTLTHMEEIANYLRLYKFEYNSINRMLDKLITKQKKKVNSSNKPSSKLTSEIEELKSQKRRCIEKIEYYKFNLFKVMEKAVDNYLKKI